MDFIRLETKRLHSETQKWLDPMVSSSGTSNRSVLQTGKWTDIMLFSKNWYLNLSVNIPIYFCQPMSFLYGC